jgi:predicted DNA-binding transcriptional regulator YafY
LPRPVRHPLWYVIAWYRRRNGARLFRADRIHETTVTDHRFTARHSDFMTGICPGATPAPTRQALHQLLARKAKRLGRPAHVTDQLMRLIEGTLATGAARPASRSARDARELALISEPAAAGDGHPSRTYKLPSDQLDVRVI